MKTAIRRSFRITATLPVVALLLTITLPTHRALAQTDAAPDYSSSSDHSPLAPQAPNTPVPDQIRNAHTIFFANDGSAPNFPYDPNASYAAVYDALQSWGHYQIAPSIQQAATTAPAPSASSSEASSLSAQEGPCSSTTSTKTASSTRKPRRTPSATPTTSHSPSAPAADPRIGSPIHAAASPWHGSTAALPAQTCQLKSFLSYLVFFS